MQRTTIFHGWIIVAVTFVLQFIAVGLAYYAFGVYLVPLTEALDADRFTVALTLSIQSVVVAILSPMAGRVLARYPVRWLLTAGTLSLCSGLALLSQVTALWQLYVLFGGLVAIGMVLLGTIPSNLLLANWFDRRRGTAMGISQFGITISATVLVPLVTWLILQYGFRVSLLVCAAGACLVLLPLIWKFAVKAPEELGLHPDGLPPAALGVAQPTTRWTLGLAVRERDFWLITLIVGPCYMGIASVVLAMPSHITDIGLSPLQASGIVAMTTFMGALAKPLFGTLADHFDKRAIIAIAVLLQASGVAVLLGATTYTVLAVAGLLFGLGYGGIAPLWSVLLASRFGRADYAYAMGANMPMLMPFNLAGLPLTTWVFETFGSYLPAFGLHLAGYAIALTALACFRPGRDVTAPAARASEVSP